MRGLPRLAWLSALVGCGGGAAPTGTASVHITTRTGAPMVGQPVVFQASDGHYFAEELTDAEGLAEGPMDEGGTVTWYAGIFFGKTQLFSQTHVSPGDRVHLIGDRGLPVHHRLAVQLPAAPEGATNVRLWTGCAETQLDAPIRKAVLNMTRACVGPGTRLFGYAYDQEGQPMAYALANHPRADIEGLMVREWTAFEQRTRVVVSHVPHDAKVSGAWLTEAKGGRSFGRQARALPSGPLPAVSFGRAADFADELLVGVTSEYPHELSLMQRVVSATTAELPLNLSQAYLPRVHGVQLTLDDGIQVSWTSEPGLAEVADTVDIEVGWPRGHWYFLTRPGSALRVPDLPGDLDAEPQDGITATVGYSDYLEAQGSAEVDDPGDRDLRRWRASFASSTLE